LLLLCGVAGPLLFAVMTAVVGTTRSSYSHVSQFISELGETGAEFAWVMNWFGFLLSGALILIFVVASRRLVSSGALNMIGSLCLIAFAICLSLAGIYSCDVGCSPAIPTPEQKLHDLVSVIAFPAFILGVIVWGVMFLRDTGWRRFGAYSLVSGFASIVVLGAMVQSEATREGTGILQRLFLGILFTWLVALSIRLQREHASTDST
jgi:hypothetical membrane protein